MLTHTNLTHNTSSFLLSLALLNLFIGDLIVLTVLSIFATYLHTTFLIFLILASAIVLVLGIVKHYIIHYFYCKIVILNY
jgi:hypothetical protein